MKIQKKAIVVYGALISLLITAIILLSHYSKWIGIYDIEYFSGLQHETITEITLKETGDSARGVVLTDEDLITEWLDFFAALEMKRDLLPPIFGSRIAGGNPTVIVTTENATYTFRFLSSAGFKMKIAGKTYIIKNPEIIPFSKTYDEAATRYGILSFW